MFYFYFFCSTFTLNPSLLRLKDLLHKSVDADIAYVPDDVLLSNINMLLTNLPMDAASLLSEEDDGLAGAVATAQPTHVPHNPIPNNNNHMASYPPSSSPRDPPAPVKHSTEQRFWTLVMTLFMNVCAPHSQCKDSINVIEGMQ